MKKQTRVTTTILLVAIVAVLVIAGFQQEETATALSAIVTTAKACDNGESTIATVAEGGIGNGEGGFGGTDWKKVFTPQAIKMLAQTLYGEADGVASDSERSMVVYCILNRYDSNISWFGNTIEEIIAKPNQFTGYRAENPVTERNLVLVKQVIFSYKAEKEGSTALVRRTLPSDVYFFHAAGNGINHNIFYKMSDGALGGERMYFGYTPLCTAYDNY